MNYDLEFFFMCAVPPCRLCILSWFLIPVQDLRVQPNNQKLAVNKDFLQIVPWSSLFPMPVENNDFNEIIRHSQCLLSCNSSRLLFDIFNFSRKCVFSRSGDLEIQEILTTVHELFQTSSNQNNWSRNSDYEWLNSDMLSNLTSYCNSH